MNLNQKSWNTKREKKKQKKWEPIKTGRNCSYSSYTNGFVSTALWSQNLNRKNIPNFVNGKVKTTTWHWTHWWLSLSAYPSLLVAQCRWQRFSPLYTILTEFHIWKFFLSIKKAILVVFKSYRICLIFLIQQIS